MLDGVKPRVTVQEQLAAGPGDRYVLAVGEAKHAPPCARFEPEDPVPEVAEVDDVPDHGRRARDRGAAAVSPEHPAVRDRDAIEEGVVGAEKDAAAPDSG